MIARVFQSSGCPEERRVLRTVGDSFIAGAPGGRRWRIPVFFRHSLHSPSKVCWPQAHWRCNKADELTLAGAAAAACVTAEEKVLLMVFLQCLHARRARSLHPRRQAKRLFLT